MSYPSLSRFLLTLTLFSVPANAHNETEVHTLCLKSEDYIGCVMSNIHNSSNPTLYKSNFNLGAYGPIKLNLNPIHNKNGNYVLTALNADNNIIFLAINCSKRKINVSGPRVRWKGWEPPVQDFEFTLMNDFCRSLPE